MLPQTNNYYPIPKKRHFVSKLLIILVGIFIILAGVTQRQNIYDQWKLHGYTAPIVVADLANQDSMTTYARKIYYVNRPQIITGIQFNQACPNNGGEKTIILGCYKGGQQGISLLGVKEPLLNGVEQVTAAHEMLHAAYDRLSSSDKTKINAMLESYYKNDLHDSRILAIIDAYKISEPKDLVNEMHSVFGSEIAVLPQPLEAYYKKYFINRSLVAGLAAKYQAEFTNRQDTITRDDEQLVTLKTQINNMEADLSLRLSNINSQQANLLSLRSSDVHAYNAGVAGYNALVDAYNSEADNLQNLIAQYNQLVNNRNAVVLEEDQLAKELTSTAQQINK